MAAMAPAIPGLVIEEELGRGAHSVVYRGRKDHLACAVKVTRATGPAARDFRREALALARVRHPGVPRVFDVGEADGHAYLVTELVQGTTLAETLETKKLTVREAAEVALSLVRVLEAVHDETGLVHRRVDPSTVVVEPGASVRLVEFGWGGGRPSGVAETETWARPLGGPEQGPPTRFGDGRTDLRAVGRILTRCIARLEDDPDAQHLGRVIHRLLEPRGTDPYPSSAALIADLERLVDPEATAKVEDADPKPSGFVGRRKIMAQLQRAWIRAQAGDGSVVLVGGRPGSGRSRVLRELGQGCGGRHTLHLSARAGGPVPLSSIRQLVDDYLDVVEGLGGAERDAQLEGARAAAAGPRAPLVGSLSDRLARVAGLPTGRADNSDALVEALAEFLVWIASSWTGALITVDDLERLDPLSREVLVRVAALATKAPILVVASHTSAPGEQKEVARFARAIDARRFLALALPPLREADLRDLIADFLGSSAFDAELPRRVGTLSDGTPVGARDVLAALVDGGALWPSWGRWRYDARIGAEAMLPETTKALVAQRISGLSPASRRVLPAAALLGGRLDEAAVAAVSSASAQEVRGAIAEAVTAGLIVASGVGGWRFLHARIQAALVETLPADLRGGLHRRAAEALRAHPKPSYRSILEVARHYVEAGAAAPAVDVARATRAAATQAVAQLDHETAASYFRVARERDPEGTDNSALRAEAESLIATGALEDALACLAQVLSRVEGMDRAQVLGRVAWIHQMRGEEERAFSELDEAMEVVGEPPASGRISAIASGFLRLLVPGRPKLESNPARRHRSELLCQLHHQNIRLGIEYERAGRALHSALRGLLEVDRVGAAGAAARNVALFGAFQLQMGRPRASARCFQRAERIASDAEDTSACAYVVQVRHVVRCFQGRFDLALEDASECLGLYARWIELSEYCSVVANVGIIETVRGRPCETLPAMERAVARIRSSGHAPATFTQFLVPWLEVTLALLGRSTQLATLLSGLVLDPAPRRGVYYFGGFGARALVAYLSGDGSGLEALVTEFERDCPTKKHPILAQYHLAIAHARLAQCEWRQGSRAALSRGLSNLRTSTRSALFRGHLAVLQGRAAVLDGRHRKARALFDRALRIAATEKAPWIIVEVELGRAQIFRAQGHEDMAQLHLRTALMMAREAGLLALVDPNRWRIEEIPPRLAPGTDPRADPIILQLGSLTRIAQSDGATAGLEAEARHVLDEVLTTAKAKRGALLFVPRRDHATRVLVGRTGTGVDWIPPDSQLETTMARLVSGEVIEGVDRDPIDPAKIILVRLSLGGAIVGALHLARLEPDAGFTAAEVETVDTLGGQVALALELARLLEERRDVQVVLQRAYRMEAVGQLAAGTAHDLNNMLTTISVAVQSVRTALEHRRDPRESLDVVHDSTQRGARLLRQLLAFACPTPADATTVDVATVVQEMAPLLQRVLTHRGHLSTTGIDTPSLARTDRAALEQVLVNLVVNARDAMPNGGDISIEVDTMDLDETWIARGARHTGEHVRIRVRDTGVGMPPSVLGQLFDPFFTTKESGRGTGLGLATAHTMVRQCGGHIEVASEPGKGSVFSLFFPVAHEEPPSIRVTTARVLVVDDDATLREFTAEALESAGFSVRTAADGAAALRRLDSDTFDVVLSDAKMPVMGGAELGAKMRASGRRVPLILTSGEPLSEAARREADRVLRKPFAVSDLIQCIGAAMTKD